MGVVPPMLGLMASQIPDPTYILLPVVAVLVAVVVILAVMLARRPPGDPKFKILYDAQKEKNDELEKNLANLTSDVDQKYRRLKEEYDMEIDQIMERHKEKIAKLGDKWSKDKARISNLSQGVIRGHLNQVLGTFALMNEYDSVFVIASVSSGAPVDLIGIRDNMVVDFIEVKSSKGARSSTKENMLKRLVDEKKVNYRVVYGNIPESFKLADKEQRKKAIEAIGVPPINFEPDPDAAAERRPDPSAS